MSDEEVIRRRLMIDGDGTGDDRRLNMFLKNLTKWAMSDDVSGPDGSLTHERLMSQLSQCEFSITKSQLGCKMNETELKNYEALYHQIDAGTETVKAEIVKAKEELNAAKQVRSSWLDAPRHILTTLRCVRLQDQVVRNAAASYFRSGAWYSYSEAILQTMGNEGAEAERGATTLKELIEWENAHEPVLACDLSSDQAKDFITTPMIVSAYPAHTQGVEHVVKEVTAAYAAVFGFERRDGFIRGRAAHMVLMPMFASEQDLINLQRIATE